VAIPSGAERVPVAARRTTVVWFRRDLRVADHAGLSAAAEAGEVVALFVLDPGILGRRHHRAPARLRFLRAGLEALDVELRARGSRLVVRYGDPESVVPAVAREAEARRVSWTAETSPLGRARDARVARRLRDAGIAVWEHGGALLVEPDDLPGGGAGGHRVFAPFWRVWRDLPPPPHVPAPDAIRGPRLGGDDLRRLPAGDPVVPAGPAAARSRLVAFISAGDLSRYPAGRNALGRDGTSRLSPYLRFGMCTPAQIGRALGLPGHLPPAREAFWRQVCWRDFYHHHLHHHPEVARTALRPELRGVEWDDDPASLAAWTRGETGYPLVDAGMRQLAGAGWMHNRARIVVASFLVKDLLIDWRRGETAFMRALVDGDPANNNGGWQWTAGTGTDAAPYFRVVNPVLQARRLDPDGDYVRRHVPELRDVPARRIHEPWTMTAEEQRAAGCRIDTDYPAPRVDHLERRREVLERFRRAREAAGRPSRSLRP
jgi:deoxyribodipyrimidine photo-lyase